VWINPIHRQGALGPFVEKPTREGAGIARRFVPWQSLF